MRAQEFRELERIRAALERIADALDRIAASNCRKESVEQP